MDISILCVPLNFYVYLPGHKRNPSFSFQVEVRDLMHTDYDLGPTFDKVDEKIAPFHVFIQGDLSFWKGQ